MGIRQKNFWFLQAQALKRHEIATLAHAIGLALCSKEDAERAWDELELTKTKEDSRNMRSQMTWDLMQLDFKLRGGKGV